MAVRTSPLLLAGLGVTALAVAVTGSAGTAANAVPDTVAGYGQGTVTGATVTDVDYTPYVVDNTDLGSITFTSATDVRGKTASLTLKRGTTVVGTFPCSTTGPFTAGSMDVVCDASSAHPDFGSFDVVGLTILD
jgi:hypothetical protein